jgi:ATP-dependent Clp protease ATP-binding subunit ClpA
MFSQKPTTRIVEIPPNPTRWIGLNTKLQCEEARSFEASMFDRIVAQDDAVLAMAQLYQLYLAKMALPGKPIGTVLFLGPTGSGKTRVVEAAAEILFGDPNAMIKVDCAEFQHSHEIAKLIGSPPGYLGHRETQPLLTQENLSRFHNRIKLTLLLFDEIEKASDALWQLLLGVLDKATLTLGDNRRVDFSNCIVVMTSNLGAREMTAAVDRKLGFGLPSQVTHQLDARLEKIAIEAARRKFSPEFINRLDKLTVFRNLNRVALRQILDIELQTVQRRILLSGCASFVLSCTDRAKDFLLSNGYDRRYGARPLKRAIEKFLVVPLSNLVATSQLACGDLVYADVDEFGTELCFGKAPGGALPSSASNPHSTYGSFAFGRQIA